MAYDIQKKSEGIYVVLELTCTRRPWPRWTARLNLNEAVLRTRFCGAPLVLSYPCVTICRTTKV